MNVIEAHKIKIRKEERERVVKEVLKLIKAWNGYGDPRFPDTACEVKHLVREVKKLKELLNYNQER